MQDCADKANSRLGVKLCIVAAVVGLPAAAALVYALPPGVGSFYPPCLFHLLTGLHCPGCGATRCTHALLQGDLRQALAYNGLFVIVLPFLAYVTIRWVCGLWIGRPLRGWSVPDWTTKVLLWVMITFWVLRNIDRYPFNLLAPHVLP